LLLSIAAIISIIIITFIIIITIIIIIIIIIIIVIVGGILYEGIFEFLRKVDIIGNIINRLPIIGPIRVAIMKEFKASLGVMMMMMMMMMMVMTGRMMIMMRLG
jgi:hypothetical protein